MSSPTVPVRAEAGVAAVPQTASGRQESARFRSRPMTSVWLLTGGVHLFGITNGLVASAAPQASLALKFTSQQLGFVGAGVPAGYALGCLLTSRFFAAGSAKRVLCGGICAAILSVLGMYAARSAFELIVCQMGFGLASGAVWPFASGWMLEFVHAAISKTRLLRHYNLAWTSGVAVGMFSGGHLCGAGWIFGSFCVAAAPCALALLAVALAREPGHVFRTSQRLEAVAPVERIGLRVLWAAILFNVLAVGMKLLIAVNFAELNRFEGGGAGRMGDFMAVLVLAQMTAFALGGVYEPYLGCRRIYIPGGLLLLGVGSTFILTQNFWLLLTASAVCGWVLAGAFQSGMLAFTGRSAVPRRGTTLYEATIGFCGLTPVAAGMLTDALRGWGFQEGVALRGTFGAWMGIVVCAMLVQGVLLAGGVGRRLMR